MNYSYQMALFGLIFLVLMAITLFGGQLLVYWLIDKYTTLNFPIIYRIGLAFLLTFGILHFWLR